MNRTVRQHRVLFVLGAIVFSLIAGFGLFYTFNAQACCGSGNETHSDNDTVRDNPPPRQVPQPVCTLTASKTTITPGDTVTFKWTTKNATSATFTPVGNVAVNGSHTITFANPQKTSYTYTLRAIGLNGVVKNCPVTITVVPKDVCPNIPGNQATIPPGYELKYGKCVPIEEEEKLTCELTASDYYIKKGESVTLSWESEGAIAGYIEGGDEAIGYVDTEGSEVVSPKETTTYTAEFWNEDDDTVTCEVTVKVKKKKYDHGDDEGGDDHSGYQGHR